LMTAVCRPSLPLAPGLSIRAPEISGSGTGKGLLASAISVIAYGVIPKPFTAGHDGHELDKRLASAMIEAEQVVWLDNKNGSILRSETMASGLTERAARIRKLGSSQMVLLNTTALVVVTGNGLGIVEDLARRFLDLRLDAGCENPEQRYFKEGFLESIRENRAALLTAILTIWRWGRLNPIKSGLPIGSFEQWADWCRDPLLALGCCDPIQRIEAIKAEDPTRRRTTELFARWDAHHGDRLLQAAELADPVGALIDPRRRDHQIAARLTALAGTRAGGFVLAQHIDPSRGVPRYVLHRSSVVPRLDALGMHEPTSASAAPSIDAPRMNHERTHDGAINLGWDPAGEGRITIELGRDLCVHVNCDFEPEALARVLDVLDRKR
jgi:hypothetical protein